MRLKSNEAVVSITFSILSIAVTFLGIKILSSKLSPSGFGELNLYLTFTGISQIIISGPFSNATLRYGSYFSTENKLPLFRGVLIKLEKKISIYLIIIGVASILVQFIFFDSTYVWITISIIIYSIAYSLYSQVFAFYNSVRNRTFAGLISILEKGTRFFFPVMLIIAGVFKIKFLFFSITLAIVLVSIYSVIAFYKQVSSDENTYEKKELDQSYKKITTYSNPFILWGALQWIQTSSEKWILSSVSGFESVGIYSVYNQLSYQSFVLLGGIISSYVVPILFDLSNNNGVKAAINYNHKFIVNILLGGLALTGIAYFLSDWLIVSFSGIQYATERLLLPLLLFAGVLFVWGQTLCNDILILEDTAKLKTPKILTSILGIVLNFFFISAWGIIGLGFSLIITNLSFVLLVTYTSQKELSKC